MWIKSESQKVWEMFKINIKLFYFQIEVTIKFLLYVQQSCRAHHYLSFSSNEFINPLDTFWVKSKISTILIEHVWDLTLFSIFERYVIDNVNNFV